MGTMGHSDGPKTRSVVIQVLKDSPNQQPRHRLGRWKSASRLARERVHQTLSTLRTCHSSHQKL